MTYKLQRIKDVCLFCSMIYPKDTEQWLAHSKYSINISINGVGELDSSRGKLPEAEGQMEEEFRAMG